MWLPLTMIDDCKAERVNFCAQPDMNFKPIGLMLWDLPPDAWLEVCKISNEEVVLASYTKLPAKVFARAESYEKLKARVENGEELFSEWMSCPPMTAANRATVVLSSQFPSGFLHTRAAFWGLSVWG